MGLTRDLPRAPLATQLDARFEQGTESVEAAGGQLAPAGRDGEFPIERDPGPALDETARLESGSSRALRASEPRTP